MVPIPNRPSELQSQWTIPADAQGKDTSVMIYNVQTGVRFADNVFKVPYTEVHKSTRGGG